MVANVKKLNINIEINKLIAFTELKIEFYNKFEYVEIVKIDLINLLHDLKYIMYEKHITNDINRLINNLKTNKEYNNTCIALNEIKQILDESETEIRNNINKMIQ